MGVHEILHVVPPLAHQRVLRQRLALVGLTQFQHREEMQGLLVEENPVVVDAGVAQQLRQLRPDLVVALLVLVDDAGLELHAEGMVHGWTSLSTSTDFAGTTTRMPPP
jgi:hypothetical protein